VLGGLAAASVQGLRAMGDGRGRRGRRLGARADGGEALLPLGPRHARANGFDLHANVMIPAGQRDRLESVCRHALRPPVASEHVRATDDGAVLLQFRHRWADGTTHLRFNPVEFLGRLSALVPRPRINLIFYYGVLGGAAWRRQVVPRAAAVDVDESVFPDSPAVPSEKPVSDRSPRGYLWADLMRRTFGFDVLECPRCGGRLRLVALIEQAAVMARILRHLGLPTEVPAPLAARAPPPDDAHGHSDYGDAGLEFA
jgi:Putative transposase